MNKYKEKVLEEITNRILKYPFADEDIEVLVNAFIKVYNLPDELIILHEDGDHIPIID